MYTSVFYGKRYEFDDYASLITATDKFLLSNDSDHFVCLISSLL